MYVNAVFLVSVYCFLTIGIANAYPMLTIPHLASPAAHNPERFKKNVEIPQPAAADEDVEELEHLKRDHINGEPHLDVEAPSVSGQQGKIELKSVLDTDANLPELEQELEAAAADKQLEHIGDIPPVTHTNHQSHGASSIETQIAAQPPVKQYHGAARLAFGQHPEVFPISSTSTTTTETTTATTTATVQENTSTTTTATKKIETSEKSEEIEKKIEGDQSMPKVEPDSVNENVENTELKAAINTQKTVIGTNVTTTQETKETAEEPPIIDESTTTATKPVAARRSVQLMSPKTAETLLNNGGNQYSPFDMAQYVFWTGDENGVARAVEELIEKNIWTRERALTFLRDVRLGIEYLQKSYENRLPLAEVRTNLIKKSYPHPPTTTTTTTSTTTTTTERPFSYVHLERNEQRPQIDVDSLAVWNKLQDLSLNEAKQEISDYDEANGRAKIAEFLYTEYTLEDILYKLAKVMFTQSLAHGSDEAQRELQKLTDFLEREGNIGVIPVDLQKKVLNTLLTALSDTLREHPELLTAARNNLASPYNRLK